eukprot:6471637-Amphidinium_carterae.1
MALTVQRGLVQASGLGYFVSTTHQKHAYMVRHGILREWGSPGNYERGINGGPQSWSGTAHAKVSPQLNAYSPTL